MKSIKNKKNKFESIQFRLFAIMCLVSIISVSIIVILNNLILEYSYTYSKIRKAIEINKYLNNFYNNQEEENIEDILRDYEVGNNLDILLLDDNNKEIYSSRNQMKNDFGMFFQFPVQKEPQIEKQEDQKNQIEQEEQQKLIKQDITMQRKQQNNLKEVYNSGNLVVYKVENDKMGNNVLVESKLDNGYQLFMRIQIDPIKESVKISSRTLLVISTSMIVISAIMSSVIARRFTDPIVRLNRITKKMANLDFSEKYRITDGSDEVNELGKNVNMMSDKLENTISSLQKYNNELERDIEEKSKIDEMRKQFISDVSHELKTPIGLIQGYSEGLIENVNDDEESRKFYAEVIADEANKMDKMVKELLDLMKLEYADTKLEDEEFDLKELINEELRRQTVVIKDQNIKVEFKEKSIPIYASQKYMEKVFNNFITNAIKHCEEKNGKKIIKIYTKKNKDKIRVFVYNTGTPIPEKNINKIWDRFYKVDSSREREKGGTGIGLSLVKAIMNKYGNEFGVINIDDGVEFYCDINLKQSKNKDEKLK